MLCRARLVLFVCLAVTMVSAVVVVAAPPSIALFLEDPGPYDPTDPESTPTDPESTPTDPESTPTDPESTPTDPEPTPTDPEPTPTDPEPTPTDPEPTPTDPEPTPTDPEPTPTDPEPTPTDPEPTPTDPEPTPTDPTPTDPTPTPDPEPDPELVDACGPRPSKGSTSRWACTFVDNFDGTEIDPTKWLAQETAISGVTNGAGGCYLKEPWTVSVAKGTLRLTARRTKERTCQSPYGSFRTDLVAATVTTKGRFNQAYGRFSFRAAMPNVQTPGVHSALWLYPDRHTYGVWPFSGEIDVAERFSALPDRIFPSVHYVDGLKNVHTGRESVIPNPSKFHVYTLIWTPKKMSFYYDGVLAYQHAWNPLAPLLRTQPFDQPFNVVLTQAWGGLWNSATAETPDLAKLVVDWVKVWK